MNSLMQPRRWPAVLVLAALALGTLAPLAEAGHGNGNGRGNEKGKRKGRDGDERVESTWRGRGDRVQNRWSARGDRVQRNTRGDQAQNRWTDRSFRYDNGGRDRSGYRSDTRWRGSSGRDIYVDRRVVRQVQPIYRTRTVYRDAYRPSYRHRAPYATYTVWRRPSSGAVFAGFVGGLFLGATLSNTCPAGFVYFDPYCHSSFPTLSAYYSHCGYHHHTRTVQVIEIADGYDYDDYHYCDDCDEYYWGDDHDCDD